MSSHSLNHELEQAVECFDFFAALRLLECRHPDKPRFGVGLIASDDVVRFCQKPELVFSPTAIAGFKPGEPSQLVVNFMGLFGPNGPLPLHLTEYARERQRHHHDPTFARFADIFHHRMISLFYRAWANARPTVHYDRPESDRFSIYVGALLGIGGSACRDRDELADRAKQYYAAHFSGQTKHPEGLRAIINDILRIPVSIEEFIGEWMPIQVSDQSRLGWSADMSSLGQSALLGAYVWSCQHKFRVVLGPLKLAAYLALLPGGASLGQLSAIVRNYIGDEFVWDAQLILEKAQVPPEVTLGQSTADSKLSLNGNAQLGWDIWLGPRHSQQAADDLLLNPFIGLGTV